MQRIWSNPGTAVTPTITIDNPNQVVTKLRSSKPREVSGGVGKVAAYKAWKWKKYMGENCWKYIYISALFNFAYLYLQHVLESFGWMFQFPIWNPFKTKKNILLVSVRFHWNTSFPPLSTISGQIIICHPPGFVVNLRGFPLPNHLNATFWGKSVAALIKGALIPRGFRSMELGKNTK